MSDSQTTNQTHSKQRCLFNSLKYIVIGLISMVFILLLIVMLLISTETGTHWLIRNIVNSQNNLSIEKIKGTLTHQLSLQQLNYQDEKNFSVQIARIDFDSQLNKLLQGQLLINTLKLSMVTVKGQVVTHKNTAENNEIPNIPFSIRVNRFEIDQFNWKKDNSDILIQQLLLSAKLQEQVLSISQLHVRTQALDVQANSEIKLQDNWPLTTKITWKYHQNSRKFMGDLSIRGSRDQYNLNGRVAGDVETRLNGWINLLSDQPVFDLKGHIQKLQWPLTGKSQIKSNQADFLVRGSVEHYQIKLNAEVNTFNNADFSLTLAGEGNQKSLKIAQILLKPKQGELTAKGQINWEQVFAFDLAFKGQQLNLQDLGLDIPSQLALQAYCKGQLQQNQINAELDLKQLQGSLHKQPLRAHGKIKLKNKQFSVQQLVILAGHNQLNAHGKLNKQQLDLKVAIEATDLQTAWPTLSGNLTGNLNITGTSSKPIIISHLQGQRIAYQQTRIGQFSVNTDYHHASKQHSNIEFLANDIHIANQQIKRVILKAQGNPDKHTVKLKLHSSLTNLLVETHGQWHDNRWLGQISRLTVNQPQFKHWQLDNPADILITKLQKGYTIDFTHSCLRQNNARICASSNGNSQTRLKTQIDILELPLALFEPWTPEGLTITGSISAHGNLLTVKQQLSAQIDAKIANGKAKIQLDDSADREIPFTTSGVHLGYKNQQLISNIQIGLAEQDYINTHIYAGKPNAIGIRKLSGTIQTKISQMSIIDSLFPEIKDLQGLLTAKLKLLGNTKNPLIVGSAQWQDGQFEIAKLGNNFHDIIINVKSSKQNPQRLQIKAQAESDDGGDLSAQGYLDLYAEQNYPTNLTVTGTNFLVCRIPEAEVFITPSLQITRQNEQTKIKGRIHIDSAKLDIKTVPESAITPSEDEVIVSKQTEAQKTVKQSNLNADILIDFGKKTHFTGFGLKTVVTGQLKYRMHKSQQSMHGNATMKKASYRAYGQDLSIRKGEFLFNGPVDNPALFIEAIRKATNDKVTAVLKVTGPLKSPKTKVYTEPPLPESEALSYLVTGKSLNNIGKNEGGSIATAAFNYGAGQLSWLSQQLGIDEFEFKGGENIKDSAVKLGHYLNPDLYVGVTMGLFSSSYAVNLRYQINKYFSIGTRAGETQRIDLKYHLEAD